MDHVVFNRTTWDATPSIRTLSIRRAFNAAFGPVQHHFETSLIHFGSFQ